MEDPERELYSVGAAESIPPMNDDDEPHNILGGGGGGGGGSGDDDEPDDEKLRISSRFSTNYAAAFGSGSTDLTMTEDRESHHKLPPPTMTTTRQDSSHVPSESSFGSRSSTTPGLLDRMERDFMQLNFTDGGVVAVADNNIKSSKFRENQEEELRHLRRRLFEAESFSSMEDNDDDDNNNVAIRRDGPKESTKATAVAPCSSSRSSVQNSIDKIREQASRVDVALALDQLETVKMELEETRRQLGHKREQLEEHRAVLRLKDDRLATLELERDLYKADAVRLVQSGTRSNRSSSLHWRRDRSSTQSTSPSTGSVSTTPSQCQSQTSTSSSAAAAAPIRLLGVNPPIHPTSVPEEDTSGLSCSSSSSSAPTDGSSSTTAMNRGDRLFDANIRRVSPLEASCLQGTKRLASILLIHHHHRKKRGESAHPARPPPPSSASAVGGATPTPTPPLPSRPPSRSARPTDLQAAVSTSPPVPLPSLGGRLGHQQPSAFADYLSPHAPARTVTSATSLSLEAQVSELQSRLEASVETADELRRRLAAVHGFYERTLRTLKVRWETCHLHSRQELAREWQLRLDRTRRARQRAVDALEAKLREKDDEIERLSSAALSYEEI